MSAKKSKHMTGKAFTVEVCDAVRHHVGCRKVLESNRKKAFEDRDAAIAELNELKDKHSSEALKIKERHSDAIIQIDDLSTRIKFHSNQVDELVEKADEPEFEFMYDFEDTQEKDDDRPVGKPGTPKPVKGGKGEPVPETEQPQGYNQHLTASVNELGLNDSAKQKVIDAGFVTINALHQFIESGKSLSDKLNAGENVVSSVKRAVKTFLKEHTAADMKATKESGGSTR